MGFLQEALFTLGGNMNSIEKRELLRIKQKEGMRLPTDSLWYPYLDLLKKYKLYPVRRNAYFDCQVFNSTALPITLRFSTIETKDSEEWEIEGGFKFSFHSWDHAPYQEPVRSPDEFPEVLNNIMAALELQWTDIENLVNEHNYLSFKAGESQYLDDFDGHYIKQKICKEVPNKTRLKLTNQVLSAVSKGVKVSRSNNNFLYFSIPGFDPDIKLVADYEVLHQFEETEDSPATTHLKIYWFIEGGGRSVLNLFMYYIPGLLEKLIENSKYQLWMCLRPVFHPGKRRD